MRSKMQTPTCFIMYIVSMFFGKPVPYDNEKTIKQCNRPDPVPIKIVAFLVAHVGLPFATKVTDVLQKDVHSRE